MSSENSPSQASPVSRSLRYGAASASLSVSPQKRSLQPALLARGGVTVVWSGQPADYRDDELDLVDDYDPKLDLLYDLDDWDED